MLDKSNFSGEGLRALGFGGFVTMAHLRRTGLADVPGAPGVYAMLREDLSAPALLGANSGGSWKGKSPHVVLATLHAAWVEDAYVLYFGKATSLRDRIRLYLDYGSGKNVPHYGGRYLWHLDRTDLLLVAWAVTEPASPMADPPSHLEALLIQGFKQVYGTRPFANLRD